MSAEVEARRPEWCAQLEESECVPEMRITRSRTGLSGAQWHKLKPKPSPLADGLAPADRKPQGQIKGKSPKYSHVVIRKCSFNKTHYRLLAKAGGTIKTTWSASPPNQLIWYDCQNNISTVAMEIQADFSGGNPTPRKGLSQTIHLHHHHH